MLTSYPESPCLVRLISLNPVPAGQVLQSPLSRKILSPEKIEAGFPEELRSEANALILIWDTCLMTDLNQRGCVIA